MTVVVFGCANMDQTVRVAHLPKRGETIIGDRFFSTPGGKGANQAVAASLRSYPSSFYRSSWSG